MAHRYVLVCLCSVVCHAAGQSTIYALKGGEVTLKPDTNGDLEGILWKHNGNKVVEFYGREENVYDPYKNRVTLDWVTAVLSITDLRFEDSGEYKAEVDNKNGLLSSTYLLEVIEKVASPKISCEMSNGGSTNISAQLRCSAEPRRPLMKFEWRTHGNLQAGQQLHISLGAEHNDEVYTCNVSNPLSSETATFTAKDCYPESSSVAMIVGMIVGIIAVVVIVGIVSIVLVVLFFRHRRKACFRPRPIQAVSGSDEEKAQGDENMSLLRSPNEVASSRRGDGDSCHSPAKESDKTPKDDMPQKGHVLSAKQSLFGQNKDGQSSQKKFTGNDRSPQSYGINSPAAKGPASDDKGDADQHGTPTKRLSFSENPLSDLKSPIAPEDPEPAKEAGQDKEAQPAPAGDDEEAQPAPAGDDEEAHSAPAGDDEEAQPAPAGDDEEAHSAPAGDDEEAHSAPAGDDEEAHSAPAGDDEEAQPAPAGDDEEAHSAPAGASPAAQPHSPKGSAGEHKGDTNSDQVTTEENDRGSDSLNEGETNESDDKPNTITDQKGSKTSLHEQPSQGETNSSDSVGDREEADQQQDLYSDTSQPTQDPTPTKPDNRNTDTLQESPHTAHSHPGGEEELKPSRDSDEGAGQSDKGESETVENPGEEKPGSESCSEDEDGQRRDKVVA